MEKRIHRSCGGEVVNRKCQKCSKTWGRLSLMSDVEDKIVKFDEKAYKKRIRNLEDLR